MAFSSDINGKGLLADRPAAAPQRAGVRYWQTDGAQPGIYRCSGSTWEFEGEAGATAGDAQAVERARRARHNGGFGGGSFPGNLALGGVEFFDATTFHADAYGFWGACEHDGYIYYPVHSGTTNSVLRYNTRLPFDDAGSYEIFDTDPITTPDATSFAGVIPDERYLYFVPFDGNSGQQGTWVRFDTTGDFTDEAAWSAFDLRTVNTNAKKFIGGLIVGDYLYLVPNGNESGGLLVRYDLALPFGSAGSYTAFDTATVDADSIGFYGAVTDGRYLFLIPNAGGTLGQITRYDTSKSFTASASYDVFDLTTINAAYKGYFGAFVAGTFLYLVPYSSGGTVSGKIIRYDLTKSFTASASYEVFDATTVDSDAKGFNGGFFDGRFAYFVPGDNGLTTTKLSRWDSQKAFNQAGSYEVLDLHALDADASDYVGAATDGQWAYLAPFQTGLLARFPIYQGD